jgi:deoxyribose-phosphate aldolase
LNTLLAEGQLSAAAQSNIINFVATTTNFPYGSPPTTAQMRDRVRAVVHLIATSPDCVIQK